MPRHNNPAALLERPFLKLRARDAIGAEEEQALRDAVSEVIDCPAGRTIIPADREIRHSTLLLDGFLARFRDLRDGSRQITELHVPGDFADLHSFTLKRLDHAVMTMSPARIAQVPHERLTEITERFPHLTRVFWFSTNMDAAIHREWAVSLGRRTAIARTAHLFCELRVRLALVGLCDGMNYALPLTQIQLAECLGLTSVHVNRVLRDLRERRLVEYRSGQVAILDLDGLLELADFDPGYLFLKRSPL